MDCDSFLKCVVTRDDDKVVRTEQFGVGLGFHTSAEASVCRFWCSIPSGNCWMNSQQRWICVPIQMQFMMSLTVLLFTTLELRALETWSVRLAKVSLTIHSSLRWSCAHWKRGRSDLRQCKETDRDSHVNRVDALSMRCRWLCRKSFDSQERCVFSPFNCQS